MATNDTEFNWAMITAAVLALVSHLRLLVVMIIVLVVVTLTVTSLLPRSYTAVAIIGPPGPSPTDTLMSSGGGGYGNVLSRVIGGSSGGTTNDSFQEYLQLLQSVRLARVLVEKDHLLQVVFASQWDAQKQQWQPPGPLRRVGNTVRGFLGMPPKKTPDVDALHAYLSKRLTIDTVQPSSGQAGVSALLSRPSLYSSVSFQFSDPVIATHVLDLAMREADDIIRQSEKRDVSARLTFLQTQIPTVTIADQREALISTLSQQEQLEMMIEANQRFASTLVDPPYASDAPTSPKSPLLYAAIAVFLAVIFWCALVFFAVQSEEVHALVDRVERRLRIR